MTIPDLTIRDLRVRSVAVPMRRALGTSATKMATALLALFDLETEEGVTGRAYAFGVGTTTAPIHGVVRDILATIKGERAAPADIHGKAGAALPPVRPAGPCRHRRVLRRRGVLGCAGARRRRASGAPARRRAARSAGLQQQWARPR